MTCLESCESSSCERTCLHDYTSCYVSCPCFDECPSGCDGCASQYCVCDQAQIDNDGYKQCIDRSSKSFDECIKNCRPDEECFDNCYNDFKETSQSCPCMSGCEWGCPCDNDAFCQENVMVEDRHFVTPRAILDDYYYGYGYFPFLYGSGSALVNGEMFFFGGQYDNRQIAKLQDCEFKQMSMRLAREYTYMGSLVVIPSESGLTRSTSDEIVLYSGNNNYGYCQEIFEHRGTLSISEIDRTQNLHTSGCMGLFDGKPLIVAGGNSYVEILGTNGWAYKESHPLRLQFHACLTIDDGVITTGGYKNYEYIKDVFFLQNGAWSQVGELSNTYKYGSMIIVAGGFLVVDGGESNMVERVEWDGNHVTSTQNLTEHTGDCYRPTLFLSSPDECKRFCSSDYCYV
ncbi:Oidioi.mRNA.OKI2018_I69.chr2.g4272.t1.cds [Oikopleura dioica]|uniref:Oidioi.mRNA.OKI2018_I69.chr2.g4272.t1.cds n=1 Tax=Oikopleura dioica TaxID=34765 RepID=A0ABN7SWT7_OIKDI|nr:Oidioi.mRNA.OKI2018_I69.chr2.g4272.t1.cds [Oikopleura dioica]